MHLPVLICIDRMYGWCSALTRTEECIPRSFQIPRILFGPNQMLAIGRDVVK